MCAADTPCIQDDAVHMLAAKIISSARSKNPSVSGTKLNVAPSAVVSLLAKHTSSAETHTVIN